jgi:hypothetical protein
MPDKALTLAGRWNGIAGIGNRMKRYRTVTVTGKVRLSPTSHI